MCKKAISEDKYEEISNLYKGGLSIEKLCNIYKVSNSAIKTVLKKTGTTTRDDSHKGRKYQIDETYFENINTKNKAYVLGMMYSDGSNSKNINNIRIELQERDASVLDKIKNDMKCDYPIRVHELNKKNPNHQNTKYLCVTSKKMSNDLDNLGVIQNKSLVIGFPTFLKDDLYSDFLRGVFDGDGHIEWRKTKFITFCATKQFCESLQSFLKEKLDIESKIYNTSNINSNTKVLYVFKKKQIYKLLNYMYDNSEIYIERKYKTYLSIKYEMNDSLIA